MSINPVAHTDADPIPLGSWEITPSAVTEYLAAVGDTLPVYRQAGITPPLFLVARVVAILLERLAIPDGAIHSLQDLTVLAPAPIGTQVSAAARLQPPRQRGGMRFLTVNYTISQLPQYAPADAAASDASDTTDLLQARTTILLPTR